MSRRLRDIIGERRTMGKSIVVYFSRGDEEYEVGVVNPGNTEILAKEIVRLAGA